MSDDDYEPRHIVEKREATEQFNKIIKEKGWSKTQILSRRRDRWLVDQRQIIAKRLRREGYSYPLIGEVMNRDHTSIMHLCRNRE